MTPVIFSCSQVSNMHGRLGNARKPERQVTRMVVVMIVAFMVAWTPYAAFSIVVTALPNIHLDPRLAAVPAFFSKTAAVYNPIIYVFMNKQVTFTFMHVSVRCFHLQCKHCLGIKPMMHTFLLYMIKRCSVSHSIYSIPSVV